MRAIVDGDAAPGALLVLPWSAYRVYAWNPGTALLDPAVKAFSRRVIADDVLVVGQTEVGGEDPWAKKAAGLLAAHRGVLTAADCADLNVRYILIEEQPNPDRLVTGLPVAFSGPDLTLYRVPG